jgi:urea transport system permease protein
MLDVNPTTPAPSAEKSAEDAARSLQLYQSSQTFLLRMPDPRVYWLRAATISGILLFFFAVIPLLVSAGVVPDYKLNILGKYLCFAIVALGIDLIWGYTGLLSLCQALFFALGGYAMAMHLSLKQGGGDVRPEYNDIPQFMFFNNVRELPGFWKPFATMPFSLAAAIVLPGLAAAMFGFFILRSRVKGVYFSIITQALAWAAYLLISRNEMLLGGTNGLTNFYKPMMQARGWIISLYLLTLAAVCVAYFICRAIVKSRLGRVLIAVRDKETRLYFAGYKPYAFKVFAFSVGAMLAAMGGMLYSPQVGIITPQDMNVEASIFMVVGVAVGGRGKLWGAVFGALLMNVARSALSSDLPTLWPFVLGGVAVTVVLFFPEGFAGIWSKLERQVTAGEGYAAAALTSLPLIVIALFVMLEALGLMPTFLEGSFLRVLGLPLKYWFLVAILATVGATSFAGKWAALRRQRGFPVVAATATAAPEGV